MTITPIKIGVLNITLQRIIKNDTIILGTRSFNVKNLPPPIPTLNDKSSGFILRDSLINTEGIKAIIPDFNFNIDFKIIKYTISGDFDKGSFIYDVVDNKIDDQLRYCFSKIRHNSNIVFKDIIVTGPDNIVKNIGSLTLNVVRWISYENIYIFRSSVDEAVENQDWQKLQKLGIENVERYYANSIGILSNMAYYFYLYIDDKEALNYAVNWAERSIELGSEYFGNYALLLHKVGRNAEAEKVMNEGILKLKQNEEPTEWAEDILDDIRK